jgi:hypothetical protein
MNLSCVAVLKRLICSGDQEIRTLDRLLIDCCFFKKQLITIRTKTVFAKYLRPFKSRTKISFFMNQLQVSKNQDQSSQEGSGYGSSVFLEAAPVPEPH